MTWRTKHGEAQRYYRDVVLAYEGDECLIWPYGRTAGYGVLGKKIVSRLVCEEEHGPPPTPKHEAAHSCGKGHEGCVTKAHVSWKTHAENMEDMVAHGASPRGERHGCVKLTEPDIHVIRGLKGQMSQREIGEMFGVDQSTVSYIHKGQRWGWLSESEAA